MSDVTADEQKRARAALQFLHVRLGTWRALANAMGATKVTMMRAASGRGPVSPALVFRIARFAKVPVGDVLSGAFPPPGTCPHCGHVTV